MSSFEQSAGKGVRLEARSRKPRICMPTGRSFRKQAFYCAHYEAQDVLANTDDVDLICVEPGSNYSFKNRWTNRLLHRDFTKTIAYVNPGLRKVRLTQDYELFILRCQVYEDLFMANAIEGWKDHCKVSVCWIDEMWASLIPQQKHWLHALSQFDHVFVGCAGTVKPLAEYLGQDCHYLPGAVDALRFSPVGNAERVVDVYSIGRRWEGIHEQLLRAARRDEIFYIHDTSNGAQAMVFDHAQHRDHLAGVAKRSRTFVVAPAKMVDPLNETGGQVEVGIRYFEGAAAGAMLMGQAPKCDAFSTMFPYPDAVAEIRPDGADVLDVLHGLAANPERTAELCWRNCRQVHLQHDWIHRWKQLYEVAGITVPEAMTMRQTDLEQRAALIPKGDSITVPQK